MAYSTMHDVTCHPLERKCFRSNSCSLFSSYYSLIFIDYVILFCYSCMGKFDYGMNQIWKLVSFLQAIVSLTCFFLPFYIFTTSSSSPTKPISLHTSNTNQPHFNPNVQYYFVDSLEIFLKKRSISGSRQLPDDTVGDPDTEEQQHLSSKDFIVPEFASQHGGTNGSKKSALKILNGLACSIRNDVKETIYTKYHIANFKQNIKLNGHNNIQTWHSVVILLYVEDSVKDKHGLDHLKALRDRGIVIPSVECPLCAIEVETMEHLFFNCPVAIDVWALVVWWLSVQPVNVRDIGGLFDWLDSTNLNAKKRKVTEAVVATTLWMLWRYRNDVVYEGKMIRKSFIFDYVREFSFMWVSSRQKCFVVNWTNWVQLGKMIRKSFIFDYVREFSFMWVSSRQKCFVVKPFVIG
ncbi:hypothetical protein LXL04_013648 [Taraxacum kok-saghyz]